MDALMLAQETLRAAGLLVYDPGQHPEVCKVPYVVPRYTGTYASITSNRVGSALLSVHCYVPLTQYNELLPLKRRVQGALSPLSRQLRPTGHISADMIEEEYRAHSASIEYQVLKRL